MIQLLSVAIAAGLFWLHTAECNQQPAPLSKLVGPPKDNGCWTQWFDRDNPSGSGDWETLSSLQKGYPGKICSKPIGVEAKTLSGLTATAAGDVIFKSDTTSGFVCRNQDQPKKKWCNDYRVRFSCPTSFCDTGCWTQWFDRDNPSGSGDWETLSSLQKGYPGKICSKPAGVEAKTLSGLTASAAGDVIYKSDTTSGFVCRNQDQPKKKWCNDYRVRFSCPTSFCDTGCWTQWFDRDNPSGSGDWETLSSLQKGYPGKICSKPISIEAKTLSGLTASAAGDVIYKSDATSGFVCRNQDQPKKKWCNDYRVRFSCPPSFCNTGCWTQWFDRDNPSGSGDWETLSSLQKGYPGKICSNPIGVEAKTLSGLTATAAGDVIYKSDTTSGFVCRNQDQPKKKWCNDYRVRFSCPPSFCDTGCWTEWFDRDNPSGSGDWETLSSLQKGYPGKICSKPIGVEAKTLSGLTATAAGDVIYKSDTTSGFVCRNQDQPKKKWCNDYRVRFSCPTSFCDTGCWTQWFDRDNPSGSGDWETLSSLQKGYPGKICSKPIGVEAKTLSGLTASAAGDVIYKSDATSGFVCRNQDQPKKKWCNDYRVRFSCPPSFCNTGCWTQWFDRDNPSGSGDWETLSSLQKGYPGKICSNPIGVEAKTLSGLTATAAGDVIYKSDTTSGFVCRNQDQPKKKWCNDYRVRFSCPPSFCDTGCWTQWFDRDNPSGSGDWETLSSLQKGYPGKICSKPIGVEAKTLSGLTASAAGDVIYKSDTTSGFVCRNQDQPKKKWCNDYRVRFSCPTSFCDTGCWTQWFDRDNPSGSGDWETLSSLQKGYPGKICSKPIGVEAKTLSGLTASAAGDVIYKSDTTSGFVCRNQDQHKKKWCNDYRVRFSCPTSFCDTGCWTEWFDRDNPSGSGDWETLSSLQKGYPGKICSKPIGVEAKTLSGLTASAAGDVIYKSDTTSGFVCRNQDQPKKKWCNDYRVRFSCPPSFCNPVTEPFQMSCSCWTQWFDRDNPSGTGDWETLSDLLKENSGKICANPIGVEATTLSGLTATAAGDVIYKSDTTSGFVCRNKDQPKKKWCNDYRVRFSCPTSFCDTGCWTQWFDRDNPSGSGDWETLSSLQKGYPGKICSKPIGVEAKTLSGLTASAAGDVIYKSDTTSGFVCRNQDQPKKKWCNDYRVRFSCPASFCNKVCWTKWYDRDDPSVTGDWEILSDLKKANPGQICDKPLQIEVVTTDTLTPAKSTGEIFHIYNPTQGFACRKKDQKSGKCRDYKVRFGCPCKN